jgi:hypothetical protein
MGPERDRACHRKEGKIQGFRQLGFAACLTSATSVCFVFFGAGCDAANQSSRSPLRAVSNPYPPAPVLFVYEAFLLKMSQTLDVVLARLREFSNSKLAELDSLCDEHKRWLQLEVDRVRQQLGSQAPPNKRQKVQADVPSQVVSASCQPCALSTCRLRASVLVRTASLPPCARCSTGHLCFMAQAAGPARGRARRGKAAMQALETVAEEEEEGQGGVAAAPATELEPAAAQPAAAVTRPRRGRKQGEQEAAPTAQEAPGKESCRVAQTAAAQNPVSEVPVRWYTARMYAKPLPVQRAMGEVAVVAAPTLTLQNVPLS